MLQSYKGLNADGKEEIKQNQKGMCGICFAENVLLVIDHDHETGFVRKALCYKCNAGLGMFDDDYDTLLRAACYVLVHKAGLDDLRIGYRLMFEDMSKNWSIRFREIRKKAQEQLCQAKQQVELADVVEDTPIAAPVGQEMSTPKDSVP